MAKDETAPAAETRAQKFTRLANSRVNKALDAIALIGGLASRTNYEYTAEQAEKIGAALNGEVSKLGGKFAAALEGKTVSEDTGFSL
jgi:hypothetical protein